MTTTITMPTTEKLNGILEKQAPSLISVNMIATQLNAESQAIVEFCESRGVFVAPLFSGGEHMMDFGVVDEGFIRDFALTNLSKTLDPIVRKGVEAISFLRNGTTKTVKWKLAEKGKSLRDTVVNLIAKNDPSGEKGFIQSLQLRDAAAEELIEQVVKKFYGEKVATRTRLWKEVAMYCTELESGGTSQTAMTTTTGSDTATQPPTGTQRRKRQKRTEKPVEQPEPAAAQAS